MSDATVGEPVSPSPEIAVMVADIRKMAADQPLISIAIAGPPGSGKSTFASLLAAQLGADCCVIPMDGFHLDNSVLAARDMLAIKGAPETFDLAGFTALVESLKQGRARHFPTFDRDADCVVENGGTLPDGVSMLLFEGNYLLFDEDGWRDLAGKWDRSIWLDVPQEVLENRLIQRWLDQGMDADAARARAQGNDLANARRVTANALPATWTITN